MPGTAGDRGGGSRTPPANGGFRRVLAGRVPVPAQGYGTATSCPQRVSPGGSSALDLSGGFGMFKKSELERLFRDCRAGRFHPANSALSHELIAKLTLGINPDETPRWG